MEPSQVQDLLENVLMGNHNFSIDLNNSYGQQCLGLCDQIKSALKISLDNNTSFKSALELADMLVDLTWEKLHTGHWALVALIWRDCYSLASLIKASIELHGSLSNNNNNKQQQSGQSESDGLDHYNSLGEAVSNQFQTIAAAQRQLDLGIMMGGPTFRQQLDEAVKNLENRLNKLSQQQQQQHRLQATVHQTPEQVVIPEVHGAVAREQPHFSDSRHPLKRSEINKHKMPVSLKAEAEPEVTPPSKLPFAGSKRRLVPHALEEALYKKVPIRHEEDMSSRGQMMVSSMNKVRSGCDDDAAAAFHEGPASLLGLPIGRRGARGVIGGSGGIEGVNNESVEVDQELIRDNNEHVKESETRKRGVRVALPPRSLLHGGTLARRPLVLHQPSLEDFFVQFMSAPGGGQPAVMTGCMETWPALTKWQDLEYLKLAAGHRTVPVEVGRHYLSEGWGQKLMTLSEFIARHVEERHQIESRVSKSRVLTTNPQEASMAEAVVEGGKEMKPLSEEPAKGYLAQHPLFDQIPVLKNDICVPEYCSLGEDEDLKSVNAWFGPGGTETPLHTDPYHNLLAQVVGNKYIRLFSPKYSDLLYPHTQGLTTNSSRIDLEVDAGPQEDYVEYPGFADAPYIDCLLQPGQVGGIMSSPSPSASASASGGSKDTRIPT